MQPFVDNFIRAEMGRLFREFKHYPRYRSCNRRTVDTEPIRSETVSNPRLNICSDVRGLSSMEAIEAVEATGDYRGRLYSQAKQLSTN